jgi:hypothetical protein
MSDDQTLRLHDDAATKPTLETVLERINDFRNSTESGIADLRTSMEQRFEAVDNRFGRIENRLETIEDRLETMDARMDRIEVETLTLKADFRDFRRDIRDRLKNKRSASPPDSR